MLYSTFNLNPFANAVPRNQSRIRRCSYGFDSLRFIRRAELGKEGIIIGSGPTLGFLQTWLGSLTNKARANCVFLAVNHAALALEKLGIPTRQAYFVTGHPGASITRRQQFYGRLPTNIRRLVPLRDALNDFIVYPSTYVREKGSALAAEHLRNKRTNDERHCWDFRLTGLPAPRNGCGFTYEATFSTTDRTTASAEHLCERIGIWQKGAIAGGTSVGVALQLALVMGVSKINIFGVPFNNDNFGFDGMSRVYDPLIPLSSLSSGETFDFQRVFLEAIITRARSFGVDINIFGPTRLFSVPQEHGKVGGARGVVVPLVR